jgi:hypothetical protein
MNELVEKIMPLSSIDSNNTRMVSYYQRKDGLTYSYHNGFVTMGRWQTELWSEFTDDLGI